MKVRKTCRVHFFSKGCTDETQNRFLLDRVDAYGLLGERANHYRQPSAPIFAGGSFAALDVVRRCAGPGDGVLPALPDGTRISPLCRDDLHEQGLYGRPESAR